VTFQVIAHKYYDNNISICDCVICYKKWWYKI